MVVDALSRQFLANNAFLLTFSSPIPDLLTTLCEFYAKDTTGQTLVEHTTCNNSEENIYKFSKEILYYKGHIFVPDIQGLQNNLLEEYHNTPTASHYGVKATLARISASFSWSGLSIAVKALVKQCSTCQQNKYQIKKKGIITRENRKCTILSM